MQSFIGISHFFLALLLQLVPAQVIKYIIIIIFLELRITNRFLSLVKVSGVSWTTLAFISEVFKNTINQSDIYFEIQFLLWYSELLVMLKRFSFLGQVFSLNVKHSSQHDSHQNVRQFSVWEDTSAPHYLYIRLAVLQRHHLHLRGLWKAIFTASVQIMNDSTSQMQLLHVTDPG